MSAARLGRIQAEPAPFVSRHAPRDDYLAFLRRNLGSSYSVYSATWRYTRFIRRYPDLTDWFGVPLPERVGRLAGETRGSASHSASYIGRTYLCYLAVSGHARYDWEWLIACERLDIWRFLVEGRERVPDVEALVSEAIGLGYRPMYARDRLRRAVARIFLHTGEPDIDCITEEQIDAFAEALMAFRQRPDRALYFGSHDACENSFHSYWSSLHLLRVVLYHRGQIRSEPRKYHPLGNPHPVAKPQIEAVLARYLAARSVNSSPNTLKALRIAIRCFVGWLVAEHPEIDSFGEVTRDHALEYSLALDSRISERTGQLSKTSYKQSLLSALSTFFRETAAWGYDDVPGRPLLGAGDLPRMPLNIPRYIPEGELARLMDAILALECPYQRAALLIARWSGARRGEIRRLSLDCLDSYPDGTPRLRIPAGKTYAERTVPLGQEAAEAIRALQAERRRVTGERGFRDDLSGEPTHYLFVRRGTMISDRYLFETPLARVCRETGLVGPDGSPTVTMHRFRHTVGTQLAEGGAKLHTIMSVLGHTSASTSMVYARISDKEVLRDYRSVLAPGAPLTGPAAEVIRAGELPPSSIDWLRSNFLKTELELGHCLRLPQEGPCECDLYLSCAKFVTTSEYAPRLRTRRVRELELMEDAAARGWEREVERHKCTAKRIEQLLAELGEPIEHA